jgi:hypothetical protein
MIIIDMKIERAGITRVLAGDDLADAAIAAYVPLQGDSGTPAATILHRDRRCPHLFQQADRVAVAIPGWRTVRRSIYAMESKEFDHLANTAPFVLCWECGQPAADESE